MNTQSKKSRKIIVCATAVLAVLLAVCCILIFTHRDGDAAVVSLASPTAVELQGDGAELFRAAGILPAARFLYVGLSMYLYLLHVYVENVIILIQTFSVPE